MNHLECVTSKKNKWYWYLLVLFLCLIASNTVGAIPLIIISIVNLLKNGVELSSMDFGAAGIDKNLGLAAMSFSFVILLIAAIFLIKLFHGRSWKEVINGTKAVRWSRFFVGFAVWGILSLIGFAVSYIMNPEDLTFQFQPFKFIMLLIVSLIFIPIQSSSEEFLFRGYLTQGVASWTKSRWWALIIPSVLFGLLHIMNPEIKEYGFGIMMSQYVFMGLMLGIVTILDDGIELSMGIHSINNILGSVLMTYKGAVLQTDALFTTQKVDPYEDFISLIIFGSILVLILSFIYKWNFKVLNQKVITNNTENTYIN